jgi:ubiquinone/menaquinone biosynthesis C-methylase UbiE
MSFNGMDYDQQLLRDIVEWDVATWSRAIGLWDHVVPNNGKGLRALDVGARNGGLSLYLALKGCRVVCSDVEEPGATARSLHEKYRVQDQITYSAVDMAEMQLPSNSFDIVAFKSVLPSVGYHGKSLRQLQSIKEVSRVLRPGGLLLFAENLAATRFHMFFRRQFTGWGRSCGYLTLELVNEFLSTFSRHEYETYGFFATFGRSEGQRRWLHNLDVIANPLVPPSGKYLVYGYAVK